MQTYVGIRILVIWWCDVLLPYQWHFLIIVSTYSSNKIAAMVWQCTFLWTTYLLVDQAGS